MAVSGRRHAALDRATGNIPDRTAGYIANSLDGERPNKAALAAWRYVRPSTDILGD
jgi:hypothetical protein